MKRAKESIFTQEARLTYWQTRPHICGLCGKPIVSFSDMHLDHIIPVSKGGETSPQNIQLTHAACNLRKRDRMPTTLHTLKAEGFASPNGWHPLCYSVQAGWYGIAAASLRGAIGLMKDAGNLDFIIKFYQHPKNGGEEYAWQYFIHRAEQFAARYFDHEVDVEKAISIYRKKITPFFYDALADIEHNCGVTYLESSPHRVQFYDTDSDMRVK